MLNRIEIRNFKAIQDGEDGTPKPLILENLAQVNYLVGKNGSGKSSVLEGLALTNMIKNKDFKLNTYVSTNKKRKGSNNPFLPYHAVPPASIPNQNITIAKMTKGCKIYLSYKDLNKTTKIYFQKRLGWYSKTLNANNFYIKSKSVLFSNSNQYDTFTALHGELPNLHHYNNLWWLSNIEYENFDYHEYLEEYGEPKAVDISNLDYTVVQYLKKINALEGSNSDGIHYLRSLVNELHYYSVYNFNQFLIDEPENSLHPEIQKMLPDLFKNLSIAYPNIQFLVSTHSSFIVSAAAKEDNQKVYLIEGGQCNNSNGYEGYESKELANKELGSGWSDFNFSQYIVCEGEVNKINSDERIYNLIFQPKIDCKFISVGGFNAVKSKTPSQEIIKMLFGEVKIFGFFDKDLDGKQTIIDNLKNKGINSKETRFRELESYLYHPSVIKVYNNMHGTSFTLPVENDLTVENKHMHSYFKNDIMAHIKMSKEEFEIELAKIIREEFGKEELRNHPNNIYWQLHTCIFGEK